MCSSLTLLLRYIIISTVISSPYSDAFTRYHSLSSRQIRTCTSSRIPSTRNHLPRITSRWTPIDSKRTTTIVLAASDSKQLARQLYKENVMPVQDDDDCNTLNEMNNGDDSSSSATHHYDQNTMSPLESEFKSLMNTFLTYTSQDIRSLTSTSCRYLDYAMSDGTTTTVHSTKGHNHHARSKEVGIRYRALFEGVQRSVRCCILHI
jgi:hypothetical protein